jgi:hypothetical protein
MLKDPRIEPADMLWITMRLSLIDCVLYLQHRGNRGSFRPQPGGEDVRVSGNSPMTRSYQGSHCACMGITSCLMRT